MTAAADVHLTPEDLAARLQIEVQAVYLLNHKRTGPAYMRIGKRVRYRLADVLAWERSRLTTP